MSRIFISASHKSSGKTTLSLGLCRALRNRGLVVHPFKKGPDYIDPMWLGQAAAQPCHNLDFYTMEQGEILDVFSQHTTGCDVAVIEGNKGLYDGLDLDGSNSNAALAKLLQSPVILVIDVRGMTRGIAPLILGYQAFDRDIRIAGVIFNQLGGSRHESKLRAVVEHYTDVEVVGAVYRNPDLEVVERHLGLIPSNEQTEADNKIDQIAAYVDDHVDLDRLLDLAAGAPDLPARSSAGVPWPGTAGKGLRLGIIRDSAFGFYYPGDLQALERQGVEIVYVNALCDPSLPPVDGLFIGGGFPETHMQALEANTSLRRAIRQAVENGLPVYAECGGLMYLARKLCWQGRCCEMVGALPVDVMMEEKPQGRGYVRLKETFNHPWPKAAEQAPLIMAHEFHYSRLEHLPSQQVYAYEVQRGQGITGAEDGLVYKNVLASYSHMRHTYSCPWTTRFVDFMQQCKSGNYVNMNIS